MRVFCITACKRFTNTNTKASSLNLPIATHRIAVLSSHACGFVLQLANFLQIQKHHHSNNKTHVTHRIIAVLSSHACVFETACKRFTKKKPHHSTNRTGVGNQSPKSPNPDLSFGHPNGVSCPYEHL
jgi:hypothetical protein